MMNSTMPSEPDRTKKKVEPPLPDEKDCRAMFEKEAGNWVMAGRTMRFFLRDDDAVDHTPALDRLIGICEDHSIPLLLAIIPEPAKPALRERLLETGPSADLITPAVHGYAHKNHASKDSPHGRKACELGMHRPLEIVLGELKTGRSKLLEWFGERLSGLLVPPWNRIHDGIRNHVDTVGFTGISAHGWDSDGLHLPSVNVHMDIIHWSAGGVGRQANWIWYHLADSLRTARLSGWKPVGILAHHLDHDEQAWSMLEAIASDLLVQNHGKWCKADDLIDAYRD